MEKSKEKEVTVSEEDEYIWESAAGVSFTVQNDTEMFGRKSSEARR